MSRQQNPEHLREGHSQRQGNVRRYHHGSVPQGVSSTQWSGNMTDLISPPFAMRRIGCFIPYKRRHTISRSTLRSPTSEGYGRLEMLLTAGQVFSQLRLGVRASLCEADSAWWHMAFRHPMSHALQWWVAMPVSAIFVKLTAARRPYSKM